MLTVLKTHPLLLGLVTALLSVSLVTGGGLLYLNWQGQRSLEQNASSQMPELSGDETDTDSSYSWEEDWIRYNGQLYDYNENILTLLFMGIDVADEITQEQSGLLSGQADSLFLFVMNPDTQRVSIIAIDRNTMTTVYRYDAEGNLIGSMTAQVALAHGYGDGQTLSAENTLRSVSEIMYDVPIHGYCAVNMAAIPTINDAVGGVSLTLPSDLTALSPE